MKLLFKHFLILAFPLIASAKPVVLVSYYDVFAKNKFNNSENVAKAVAENLKNETNFEIKLCAIPTAFDAGYAAVEECQKGLETTPIMYIGLGEFGCSVKMETMGRNLDKNLKSPDNDGNLRNQIIIHEAPKFLAFNHPAPEMYCSLSPKERGSIQISNNAGSFVCNNTAFQYSYYYPEISSGFIHVPSNTCRNLERITGEAVEDISKMLKAGVATIEKRNGRLVRLPLEKSDLEPLRENKADACKSEFFKKMKSADDGKFWSGLF